jgi:hypothetical protein
MRQQRGSTTLGGVTGFAAVGATPVWRAFMRGLLFCGALLSAPAFAETPEEAATREALAVMDAFMAAFNARDVPAWADTLVYPHVRIASGRVAVFPDRDAYITTHDMNAFASGTGWARSSWDDLKVVQASPDKVHIAVKFTRYNAEDQVISAFDSLYVVERVDGRWGVRARSSFAP